MFQRVNVYLNEPIKIVELIKLPNQAIHERTRDRNFLLGNSKFVVWSIEIKQEAKNVGFHLRKMHIKGEKHIAQIDFAEYLRKSDLSEDRKVYYGQFLQNGNL